MNLSLKNILLLIIVSLSSVAVHAQVNVFWNTNGNTTTNGNWLGTANNEPLVFKTNSLEAMRIKPNGEIKISAFENLGKGLVTFNNNGVLTTRVFPQDTNQVFCGSGNFKSIAVLSGWTRTGNVLYNSPGVYVGIGVNNPQYPLHVIGDAYFTGVVNAQGVILTNKLLADTMKAGSMFSLNSNLHMSAGGLNEIYTTTGSLRFQSNAGNSGHTIFNAGTNGNVGIGTFNPLFKLDVSGDVNLNGKTYVYRLVSNHGDSSIYFGDSTMVLNYWLGNIFNNNTTVGYKGLGLGVTAHGFGLHSTAIGYRVRANGNGSVVIGSVDNASIMANNIPSSLMIGFNSNIPTVFVGPSNGNGTTGNVGIATTNPQYTLDVNGTVNATQFLIGGSPFQWSVVGNDIFYDIGSSTGGSVGIGVVGPNSFNGCPTSVCPTGRYLLAVGGGIRCKALKVEPLWADDVFDSSYVLMPLDSVHAYIKRYGHLPGVQSADDVAANGIDVGETQAMLLRKVEELTLYMIEQQKQIEFLQAELEEQKKSKQ